MAVVAGVEDKGVEGLRGGVLPLVTPLVNGGLLLIPMWLVGDVALGESERGYAPCFCLQYQMVSYA